MFPLNKEQLKELKIYLESLSSPEDFLNIINILSNKTPVLIHHQPGFDKRPWLVTVLGSIDQPIESFNSQLKAEKFCKEFDLPFEIDKDYRIK